MQPIPQQLLEVVSEVLEQRAREPPRPTDTLRLSVTLECWLAGSVTTEQAIGVLRSPPPPKRR